MDNSFSIKTVFLDIGDVLLSNGWGHESRIAAAEAFNLNCNEMQNRHQLVMTNFEEGKLTLSEYLKLVVFYQERPFTPEQFEKFMFAQTTSDGEMIELIRQLKEKYHLKIVVINNEARELNEYRINKYRLNQMVDFFISSCYVHLRKPDVDIFRLALDMAQTSPENVVYIDDTPMFIDIAKDMGIRSIRHINYSSTSRELAKMGLTTG